jgi:hypothetical protein
MKNKILALALATVACGGLSAQTATDLNEGLEITHDSVGNPTLPFELTFWGRPNFYYFVLQTNDLLEEWIYHDYAVKGIAGAGGLGDVEGFRFDSSSSMLFFRIEFTDDPNAEILLADFDGDFVSNKNELDLGLNPFGLDNSEPDALYDDWEIYHFGSTSAKDGEGDADQDGILDKYESQFGTDPNDDETQAGINLSNYTYDALGRIVTTTGTVEMTYLFDDESNLQSAN